MVEMSSGADRAMRLPAVLDLAAAEEFLATLRQRLDAGRPLRLDAEDVETLTLPCAQIILSALRTHPCGIKNPSEAFNQAFDDFALNWQQDQQQFDDEPSDDVTVSGAQEASGGVQDAPLAGSQAANVIQDDFRGLDDQPEQASIQDLGDDALQSQGASPDQEEGANSMATLPVPNLPVAKRIMTIDDSKTMRDMLKFTLVDAGFEVMQGVDGQNGLDVLGDQKVDVVITDINMPIMDGYEVIRQLRRNPIHKTTPILVLTTESDKEKRTLARDAGATGWMVKPFDPDALVATINKVSP